MSWNYARGVPTLRSATAVVASLLLLPGCSSDPDDATPVEQGAATEYCTVSPDLVEIERAQLREVDQGGPLLDRDLRASRSPEGDLCLEIVIDHADPGSTALSYRIVARRGGQEWRTAGEDPNGQPPLLVDGTGCVTATGTLVALGQGGRSYRYRARLQADCDGRESVNSSATAPAVVGTEGPRRSMWERSNHMERRGV